MNSWVLLAVTYSGAGAWQEAEKPLHIQRARVQGKPHAAHESLTMPHVQLLVAGSAGTQSPISGLLRCHLPRLSSFTKFSTSRASAPGARAAVGNWD